MKSFWDERYSDADYAYGKEPNAFFKETLDTLQLKGKALFPAEGEGRNAVYAAKKGLEVTAFDMSMEAKKKALQLADENRVTIEYLVYEFDKLYFTENSFDLIVLIFAHFPPELNNTYYKKLANYLKPGGYIIAEAFSKEQLKYSEANPLAGGPKNINMLFSIDDFNNNFPDFEVFELQQQEIELSEGLFHKGKASVIRFVGKKPLM
ncbi:MAG: class I SAM-dependent methyltransferase [Flavobacteriaceae bacterium]|nr:class I SAM-dependent methyltransferase [Flavobacteriaceae bacterium]